MFLALDKTHDVMTEAFISSILHNINVIKFVGVTIDGQRFGFVAELSGESLLERLKRKIDVYTV